MTQEPTAGEALEPCPFCGDRARDPIDYAGKTGCVDLGCPGSQVVDTPTAWNRRAPASVAAEGEAVAWRCRSLDRLGGWFIEWTQPTYLNPRHYEVQPLFAHPARMPTRQEVKLKIHEWIRDRTSTSLKFAITPKQIDPLAEMMIALFTDTRGA